MEDLKTLLKELESRKEYLEEEIKNVEGSEVIYFRGKIEENKLTIIRVQQLLLPYLKFKKDEN